MMVYDINIFYDTTLSAEECALSIRCVADNLE